jgi:acetolactate synthase I/II/III large subunit
MTDLAVTGGRAVAEMLRVHSAGPMFGMAGFQLLPMYEGIRELGLSHYLVNDERAAVFAADAYARVSSRVGVCDATLGPGATNLVTGLVESLNAGIPVVAFIGGANRAHAGRNMTQEARQEEILRPAVKELLKIEDAARIPELVRRAFIIATSGRPGPVVVSVPEDIAHQTHAYPVGELYADERALRVPANRSRPDHENVLRAAEEIHRAARPVILAGGGVHLSRAYGQLRELAERWTIPVAHTLSGTGSLPSGSEMSVGLFGRYSRYANEIISDADCLLVVGCKLGEIATRRYALPTRGTTIVHLDVCPDEIGRWAPVKIALWGDAALGLRDLDQALLESARPGMAGREQLASAIRRLREAWRQAVAPQLESDELPIGMARLLNEINRVIPDDGILIADGGFAAHWSGLFFESKRAGRCFVSDRGFASIGYGLPAAIGAALGAEGRAVISITGDGGLNMSIGELETARRVGLPFTLVVVNNAASGYVKALQHSMYGKGRYQSSDLTEVDYAAVARAFGCHGIRVQNPSDISKALDRAIHRSDRPTVVDVIVTRDPAKMLPGVDTRTLEVKPGDRPA